MSSAPLPPQTSPPTYRLYTPGQVLLATLLGSPFAGSLLIAADYSRRGNRNAAWTAAITGALGTVALVALASLIPGSSPAAMAGAFGTYYAAKQLLPPMLLAHERAGGRKASNWAAAGIGAACMAAILVPILYVALAEEDLERTTVGKCEFYYSEDITKTEVQAFAALLRKNDYWSVEATTMISKEGEAYVLSLVLQDGAWDDPMTRLAFQDFGEEAASGFLKNQSVAVHLCDDSMETQAVLDCSSP